MKAIRYMPAGAVALLFVYAAASKLLAYQDFRGQLYNQAFPHWLADLLWVLLPLAELSAVGLLFFRSTYLAGLVFSAVLLILFSGYIVLVLLDFWPRVPCSCGGVLAHMGWKAHLWFNLFFLLLSLAAIFLQGSEGGPRDGLYKPR